MLQYSALFVHDAVELNYLTITGNRKGGNKMGSARFD